MPAKRLPWVKLWPELMERDKVRKLNDSQYRTWTYCLLAGSQQSTRWRFDSLEHAAYVARRPAKDVKVLAEMRFLEVRDDGVWIHDAQEYQDAYPSDYGDGQDANHPRRVRHGPPHANGTLAEHSANTPRTNAEASANAPPMLAESSVIAVESSLETEKGDRDRDGDERTTPPEGPPQPKNGRATEIDASFQTELVDEFWEAFGTREAVRDAIAVALSHKARRKCTDQRAYLRNWIRKDAETATKRRVGSVREPPAVLGPPLCDRCGKPAYVHHKGMCRDCNAELRAEAAKNGAQEDA